MSNDTNVRSVKINRDLVSTFMNEYDKYIVDFRKTKLAVSNSKAIYKGAPVPYLHIPMLYDQVDLDTFKNALEGIHAVSKRTIELYLEKEEIRALFDFSPELDALINVPHHYHATVPMGRFDIFYYGEGNFQFCELNADGASAMNEELELSQIMMQTELLNSFKADYSFESFELFSSWVEEVKQIYAEYLAETKRKTYSDKPFVAILDFIDKSSPLEFEVFQKAFIKEGFNCEIVDPRNLTEKDGTLYSGDQAIDIIYRRLVTKDLMDHYEEVPELVAGLLADKTCVIGTVKTQIIHTKRFFEALYNPVLRQYLSDEMLTFIDKHVPYTKPLTRGDDYKNYLENKDEYIIKPIDYYASKGVCAGRDYDEKGWKSLLDEKVKEDFIIQKYCPYALTENLYEDVDGNVKPQLYRTITGLFTYNEKLSGIYVRAGLNAIISGLHEGYTMSTLKYNKRMV
jgi:Uncharacterized conserved protein